ISAVSEQEFHLVPEGPVLPQPPTRESRRTVPTLAFGRLEITTQIPQTVLEETEPQWHSKDLEYFSLRVEGRRLDVGLSHTLLQLEKQILETPRTGGICTLQIDDVRPASLDEIRGESMPARSRESWTTFWRRRETFFKRVRLLESRGVIEAADWTSDLAELA